MDPPDVHIGSRIIIADRYTATIRYLGPIDGQPGDWAGLEWDDHSRGKHDGSHNGKRYFTCPSNAGSFVRLPKLLETSDFGCSLFQALQTRYFPYISNDGDYANNNCTTSTTTKIQIHGGRELEVEVKGSGATALITTNNVHQAALVNCRISHHHDHHNHQSMSKTIDSRLTSALLHLQELDLSDNLISSWDFINTLLQKTPRLTVLNVSGNKLGTVPPPPPSTKTWKGNLQTLVVNKCGVNWRDLVTLGQWFPHLLSLHACDNGIRHFRMTIEKENEDDDEEEEDTSPPLAALSLRDNNSVFFPDLQLLDLEHNEVDNWEDILHSILRGSSGVQTSPMPALRSLLLSHNYITHISPIDISSTTATHPSSPLSSLMLGSNQLSSWHSIDALNSFSNLSDLRISDNPLIPTFSSPSSSSLDGGGGDLRYETIARLGRVLRLNGSDVSRGERRDAEIIYLKKIIDSMAAVSVGGSGLKAQHPRYDELVNIYGHLTAGNSNSANTKSGSGALSGNLVTVQLILKRNTSDVLTIITEKQVTKRLPLTMTVSKLKIMIDKLLGVKPARQGLVLMMGGDNDSNNNNNDDGGKEQGEEEGEDITEGEDRDLGYYGMTEGSRVCVIECDPEERNGVMMKERIEGMKRQGQREVEHERMLQRLKKEEVRLLG